MKKISLYLDTSVIGGYFDPEFEKPTRELFNLIRIGVYQVFISELTLEEIRKAPLIIQEKLFHLLSDIEYAIIEENQETLQLSEQYLIRGVVSSKYRDDALHVAIATWQKIDYIISWNFKHLVNVVRIRGFNSVNLDMGYSLIDIRTPLEVIDNDSGRI